MNNLATPQELEAEVYPKIIIDLGFCAVGLNSFEVRLKIAEAREHCKYGLGRRLFTLRGCLQRILDISPPTRTKILSPSEKADLTSHLHCFYINNSGVINNLAWIWYHEKLSDKDKEKCRIASINLFNSDFQKHLPEQLVTKCLAFSEWYGYLKDFRDPLAHRIPFYVVPYMVDNTNEQKYKELAQKWSAELNPLEKERIMDEMDALGIYTGMIMGSMKGENLIPLHQVVTDAITLVDLIGTYTKVF